MILSKLIIQQFWETQGICIASAEQKLQFIRERLFSLHYRYKYVNRIALLLSVSGFGQLDAFFEDDI